MSVDTSRPAFRSAKSALGDLRQVTMICGSVRHAIRDLGEADVAVLDPPGRVPDVRSSERSPRRMYPG